MDGINYLKIKYSPKVIGAKRDKRRLPPLDVEVEEGKELKIGSKTFEIYDVDGHTIGHIAYGLMEDKALFSGDSLMVMGCGRLFEGTPEDMWKSLKKLKQLPKDIMIYSGHEYTEANARFCQTIEKNNCQIHNFQELSTLRNLRVIVALGEVAYRQLLKLYNIKYNII